jgi:hypothetical protein
MFPIDQARLEQRRQSQNHRGCVAAGIRYQLGGRNVITVQLREALNRLRCQFRSRNRISVLKRVDGAMQRLFQPPRPTQIDHTQPLRHRFWHQKPRCFMRRSQKK